jgi:hypothetical protein
MGISDQKCDMAHELREKNVIPERPRALSWVLNTISAFAPAGISAFETGF